MEITDQDIKEMFNPSYDRNNPKFEEFKKGTDDCYWPNRFGFTYESVAARAVEICGPGEGGTRYERTIRDDLQMVNSILKMDFTRTDLVPNFKLTSLEWFGDEVCKDVCSPESYQEQVRDLRIKMFSQGHFTKERTKDELRHVGKVLGVAEIYVYRYDSELHLLRGDLITCLGTIDHIDVPDKFKCQYLTMNEKDYQNYICAGTTMAADFDSWFDDPNAQVLIVTYEG